MISKFYKIVFYSRLVGRCSLALAGTVVVLIRCCSLGQDSSKTCKWKIGENNYGPIVKGKEEQWSFSSADLVNTWAKHANGKLESECGAVVKVNEKQQLFSSGAEGLVEGKLQLCWEKKGETKKENRLVNGAANLGDKKCMQSWKICESIFGAIVKVKVEKEQWLVNMVGENLFGRPRWRY